MARRWSTQSASRAASPRRKCFLYTPESPVPKGCPRLLQPLGPYFEDLYLANNALVHGRWAPGTALRLWPSLRRPVLRGATASTGVRFECREAGSYILPAFIAFMKEPAECRMTCTFASWGKVRTVTPTPDLVSGGDLHGRSIHHTGGSEACG